MKVKDYKIRQDIWHKLNPETDDDLSNFDIQYRVGSIFEDCIDYIEKPSSETGWMYPAKSYIVGIAYAYWLSKDFGEDFYELLNDPDLLYNNDPYFVPYHTDHETYDKIIEHIGLIPMTGIIPDVYEYYKSEFMISD